MKCQELDPDQVKEIELRKLEQADEMECKRLDLENKKLEQSDEKEHKRLDFENKRLKTGIVQAAISAEKSMQEIKKKFELLKNLDY